jgi:hypothetical protein
MPGRFLLRMPVSLHQQAALAAASDNVSLNQFICGLLAAAIEWDARPDELPSRERRYPKTRQEFHDELWRGIFSR